VVQSILCFHAVLLNGGGVQRQMLHGKLSGNVLSHWDYRLDEGSCTKVKNSVATLHT
jgi:hypothetical protein